MLTVVWPAALEGLEPDGEIQEDGPEMITGKRQRRNQTDLIASIQYLKLERDFLLGLVVIGPGGMTLN